MDQPFIVFGSPQIQREEIDEVVATLERGWLGNVINWVWLPNNVYREAPRTRRQDGTPRRSR